MSKLPALQFYVGDWRKDPGVQALGYFDRGVWFEILCLMHESDERGKLLLNGKPMPDTALEKVLGLDNQTLTSTLTTLLDYGVASRNEDGVLICRRMIKDEKLRQIRTEAGKMGGNPNLVKQNATKRQPKVESGVNQILTPSSSSSSSSSSSNKESNTNVLPKKATRIAEDFEPNEAMLKWFHGNTDTRLIDLGSESQAFINYWVAKAGKDAAKLDWQRTWQSWMLNAIKFAKTNKTTAQVQTSSYVPLHEPQPTDAEMVARGLPSMKRGN